MLVGLCPAGIVLLCTVRYRNETDHTRVSPVLTLTLRPGDHQELVFRKATVQLLCQKIKRALMAEQNVGQIYQEKNLEGKLNTDTIIIVGPGTLVFTIFLLTGWKIIMDFAICVLLPYFVAFSQDQMLIFDTEFP